MVVYTIGHSTRSLEDLVRALRAWSVQTLVDVRTVPRSRTNPQFNADVLPAALGAEGIEYVHAAGLGGLRGKKRGEPSRNTAWKNESFRNFADYAQTPAFAASLEELLERAARSTCAIMCAEAVWWRCHRRIIADYLLERGISVRHILGEARAEEAKPTPFLELEADGTLSYPG